MEAAAHNTILFNLSLTSSLRTTLPVTTCSTNLGLGSKSPTTTFHQSFWSYDRAGGDEDSRVSKYAKI
jgi:hypothetical protein